MKVFVRVKPNAKQEAVECVDASHFILSVKEPPREGRANAAVEKALAAYFNVSRSSVEVVSGQTSRSKIVEVIV